MAHTVARRKVCKFRWREISGVNMTAMSTFYIMLLLVYFCSWMDNIVRNFVFHILLLTTLKKYFFTYFTTLVNQKHILLRNAPLKHRTLFETTSILRKHSWKAATKHINIGIEFQSYENHTFISAVLNWVIWFWKYFWYILSQLKIDRLEKYLY